MADRATLTKDGERIAVDVGSQEAQAAFGKGFVLEGGETSRPETQASGDLGGTLGQGEEGGVRQRFDDMRSITEQLTQEAVNRGPGIGGILENFRKQTGSAGIVAPGVAGQQFEREAGRKVQSVQGAFKNAMRRVENMEQTKLQNQETGKAFLLDIMEIPGLWSDLESEEIQQIKDLGFPPDSVLEKMAVANEKIREEDLANAGQPSFGERITAEEKGFDVIDGQPVKRTGLTGPTNLTIGSGTITGFGSDLWANGLDFVLSGGKGAQVASPTQGVVVNAGVNGGFGNQIVIRTEQGEELWMSHLDQMNVKPGQEINIGDIIGTQGNSGSVLGGSGEQLSEQQKAAGRGTHLDITIKNADGSFKAPEEVATLLGHEKQAGGELTTSQELQAKNLAVQLFGKIGGRSPENVDLIKNLMQEGKTIDAIEDELRFAGQSEQLVGEYRDAIESVTSDLSNDKRKNTIESFERRIEEGNTASANDFLIKEAVNSFEAEQSKSIRGTQRTLEFITEIGDDLKEYEEKGGDTGFFVGNLEKVAGKLGQITDDELRKTATKISRAIQSYRRAMSGAQFSVPESKEYSSIFPNIDKTKEFNAAVIEGLQETLQGDFDFFMEEAMGEDAYQSLFKGAAQTGAATDNELTDDEAYQKYLQTANQ